jgi:hypothetical protein
MGEVAVGSDIGSAVGRALRPLDRMPQTPSVAFMSPLVSEDGVCVPDAVQHDAPHALLQTRSDGIGGRGAPLIRDLRGVCVLLW